MSSRSRWAVLGRPAFTGAVAVLAVNDHVLKGWAPGWLTGKLSDVAGVFVVGVLVGLATRRPRLGAVAVGAAFVALKLWRGAAVVVAPVLGGVTRQDPWDLIALVALVPAARLVAGPARTALWPAWRRVVIGASAAATVLTVTATSCAEPAVDALVVEGAAVYARVSDQASVDPARWLRSSDGGRRWSSSPAPSVAVAVQTRACLQDGRCYAVEPGRRVVEERGGTSRTAFEFSSDERIAMKRRANCGFLGELSSDVRVVRVDGREHVVVAMAAQGVLRQSPGGRWQRVAVGDRRPVSTSGPNWTLNLAFAPLVLIALLPLTALAIRRRRARLLGLPLPLVGLVVGITMSAASGFLMLMNIDFVLVGFGTAVLAVVVLAASTVSLAAGVASRREGRSEGSEPLTSETEEERQ